MTSFVEVFALENGTFPDIINHVFISKKSLESISKMIVHENWGENYKHLYNYLDYIWRFQLIDKQIKLYTYNNDRILIFNTGLYRNNDNKCLYLCLIPNMTRNSNGNSNDILPWKIGFNRDGVLLFDKKMLLNKYYINEHEIPIKTDFMKYNKDIQFNSNYNFVFPMYSKFTSIKEKMVKIIQSQINSKIKINITKYDISKLLTKDILTKAVETSIKFACFDSNIVGYQVFTEYKMINGCKFTTGYHVELIVPLILKINNIDTYLAITLRLEDNKCQYSVMSVISRDIAYDNTRLIGRVTLNWLKNINIKNNNIKINNDKSIKNNIHDKNRCNEDLNYVYYVDLSIKYYFMGNDINKFIYPSKHEPVFFNFAQKCLNQMKPYDINQISALSICFNSIFNRMKQCSL